MPGNASYDKPAPATLSVEFIALLQAAWSRHFSHGDPFHGTIPGHIFPSAMQPADPLSVADYHRLEAESDVKHEYRDGEFVAMAGAGWAHVRLTPRFVQRIGARLESGCEVGASDLRVGPTRYTYPDVVVICGEPEPTEDRVPYLPTPTVLMEVVSETIAERDRKDKLQSYLQIGSLQEYGIVEASEPLVTRQVRRGQDGLLRIEGGLDPEIASEHLHASLRLFELYG